MQRVKSFLGSYWHLLAWPLFCAVIMLPAAGYYTAFPSPDSSPFFPAHSRWITFLETISRTDSVGLYDLIRFIMPQLVWTDLYYWIATSATALAGYWLMRERDVPKVPALFGGGALAFAGYSFTLLSAGHRAYFAMMPYEAFTFAALTCAIRRRDFAAYALAGASAAWTFHFGPDVAASLLFVAALYALWTACVESRRPSPDGKRGLWPRFLGGCAIAGLSFAIVAGPAIFSVLTNTLAWRKAQIAESSGSVLTKGPDDGAAASATEGKPSSAKDDEQWLFATNWSLPPEEIVEFVAPSIYGTWTGDMKAPYWGRLGRSASWDPKRPSQSGFFNFRQHIVYLGAIPVALALFALAMALTRGTGNGERGTGNGERKAPFYMTDVPFWAGVGLVALLLAFGRYAPFYRFFYSIPYMSYMRAPVKLMRVVELAVAVLSGSGLAMLCSRECPAKARKAFCVAAAAGAVACAFYAVSINGSKSFASILATLGGQSLMRPMAIHAIRSLWHPLIGLSLVSAAAFALAKGAPRAWLAAPALLAALAIDIAVSTRPFLFTKDYTSQYKPNVLTETILAERERPYVASVTFLGAPQLPEWFTSSLSMNRIRRHPYNEVDHNGFLAATRGDVLGMCRITGSEFLALPASMSRSIDRKKADHVLFFNLGAAGLTVVKTPSKNSFELLRVKDVLPYCGLYRKWTDATADGWMRHVASASADTLVCDGAGPCPNDDQSDSGPAHPVGTTRLLSHRGIDGTLLSHVETDSEFETILLLLERPNKDEVATVDGVEAPVFKAGYAPYVGLRLPPGHHVVTYGRRHSYLPAFYTIPVLVIVMAFAVRFAVRRSREGFGEE